MKTSITSLLMIFCFSILTYAQTPQDRATELKEQAQSSLHQKITSKRVTYLKSIRSFCSPRELSTSHRMWRSNQCAICQRELLQRRVRTLSRYGSTYMGRRTKSEKVFHNLRFLVSKERLQMYTALKNPAQAKIQLNKLEETANLAKNDSLTETLLYTKANYYYTFNQNAQGDACFRKLISQYKEKKNYEKVSGVLQESYRHRPQSQ